MDRLNRRYPVDLEVTVTDIAAPDRVASGKIVDISLSGLGAELSLRFAAGAIVKVQIGDCALFGHVTYCTEGQSFRTGIEVVRMLMGESDLSRFNAILSETMPTTPERKFEIYRLSVVRSMPDSDLKDAHIRAIKHTLARLDAQRPGEVKRPASSSVTTTGRPPARER
jgi:hypothetical protein